MERRGDEVHVETTEVSGASREGVVRWVLIIGTLLAIVLLSIIWITGAAFQGDVEEEGNVGAEIRSAEDDGTSTDSIVSDKRQFQDMGDSEGGYNEGVETVPVPDAEGSNPSPTATE